MKKTIDSKPLIIIGTLLILISLPLAIFFGVKREQKYVGRATNPIIKPENVKISNKHPQGFTVSWTTNQQTTGQIQFCNTSSSCQENPIIVKDVREKNSQEISSFTHYVNIQNNNPDLQIREDTTYYFRIISGNNGFFGTKQVFTDEDTQLKNENILQNGIGFFVRIPKTPQPPISLPENHPYGAYSIEKPLSSSHQYSSCQYASFLPCPDGTENPPQTCCFRPNPIYGTAKNSNSEPKNNIIIYFYLQNTNGNRISSLLSDISHYDLNENKGSFSQNIANFFNTDFTNYVSYAPQTSPNADKLIIEAVGPNNESLPPTTFEIPETISSSCVNTPLNCQHAPTDNTNPIVISLKPPGELPTLTPSPQPISPSPSECNKPRDLNSDGNIDGMDIGEVIRNPFPVALSDSDPDYDPSRDYDRDLDCNQTIDGMDIGGITINPFPVFID